MTLKQLFQSLQTWFANLSRKEVLPNLSKRHQCQQLLDSFAAQRYRGYVSIDGLGIVVSVPYGNIDTYTAKLRELTVLIQQEKVVPPTWLSQVNESVALDRFFTSHDGFYLNVGEAVEKFKDVALLLCRALEPSDTATHGIHEHNLRVLTGLFNNLLNLTHTLSEVSVSN